MVLDFLVGQTGGEKSLVPQPCLLVIFGGDGDLSWRKLLPAVYNLNVDGLLPSHFAVCCFGLPSTKESEGVDPDEYIRARAKDGITRFSRQPLVETHWQDFARGLFYVPGSFGDSRAYMQLKSRLEALDHEQLWLRAGDVVVDVDARGGQR